MYCEEAVYLYGSIEIPSVLAGLLTAHSVACWLTVEKPVNALVSYLAQTFPSFLAVRASVRVIDCLNILRTGLCARCSQSSQENLEPADKAHEFRIASAMTQERAL